MLAFAGSDRRRLLPKCAVLKLLCGRRRDVAHRTSRAGASPAIRPIARRVASLKGPSQSQDHRAPISRAAPLLGVRSLMPPRNPSHPRVRRRCLVAAAQSRPLESERLEPQQWNARVRVRPSQGRAGKWPGLSHKGCPSHKTLSSRAPPRGLAASPESRPQRSPPGPPSTEWRSRLARRETGDRTYAAAQATRPPWPARCAQRAPSARRAPGRRWQPRRSRASARRTARPSPQAAPCGSPIATRG
mmetsp:Transcript_22674/g.57571  ORF Transcript_22674/g.57571 Transcript_22674/m.57571 type:complete len:245 (+) Transcript_22674:363-1097(+)